MYPPHQLRVRRRGSDYALRHLDRRLSFPRPHRACRPSALPRPTVINATSDVGAPRKSGQPREEHTCDPAILPIFTGQFAAVELSLFKSCRAEVDPHHRDQRKSKPQVFCDNESGDPHCDVRNIKRMANQAIRSVGHDLLRKVGRINNGQRSYSSRFRSLPERHETECVQAYCEQLLRRSRQLLAKKDRAKL